jgi:hypothetical protein
VCSSDLSSALDSDVVQAYEIGANSFLVKPSRLDDQKLLARRIADYWLGVNLSPPLKNPRDGA